MIPLYNDVAITMRNADTCVVAQERSVLDVHENQSSRSDDVNCGKTRYAAVSFRQRKNQSGGKIVYALI
jgi:hypothetical protein